MAKTSNVRRMNRSTIAKTLGGVAAAGLLVLAATTYHAPTPVAPVSSVQIQQADVVPQPTPEPTITTAPAPVVAPAPAPVAVAPAPAAPSWAPGHAPKGTPLPHHTDTDPNSGSYGQQTYDDPMSFCGTSGSTIDGVPQCD